MNEEQTPKPTADLDILTILCSAPSNSVEKAVRDATSGLVSMDVDLDDPNIAAVLKAMNQEEEERARRANGQASEDHQ